MKTLILVFCLFVINDFCFAQFGRDHTDIFAGNSTAYRDVTAGGSYQNGAANMIRAQGQNAADMSLANMNNQFALSLGLDNSLKYVETYFKKRQTNMYYRDLEDWQKRFKAQMKKYGGGLTREDIEYMYYRTR